MATDRRLAEIYFALRAGGEATCANPAARLDDEQLAAFVENSLPSHSHTTAVRHLASCADCYGRYADLAIACEPLATIKALPGVAGPSWLDRLVSQWRLASTALGTGAVAIIAIVAFVVGGGGRLDSELQRDLQAFADRSGTAPLTSQKGFLPDAPAIAVPGEPSLSLVRHGLDDGYAIVSPTERSSTSHAGTDCVDDAGSAAMCRDADARAYETGLWLALMRARCARSPGADLARDEQSRLERLARDPVAALLAHVDGTSTETFCTSIATLVAVLATGQ